MKKTIIALLIFLSIVQTPTKASNSDVVPTANIIETTIAHILFLVTPAIATYQLFNKENIFKKYYKKIDSPEILQFLNDTYHKITDKPINFHTGSALHFGLSSNDCVAFALGNKDIVITPDYYKIIEQLFEDQELQDINKLNIIKFIIQHEAGHIKNNDIKNRIIRLAVTTVTKMILFETIKRKQNLKGSLQIMLFTGLGIIDDLINGFFNKRQEYKADSGVIGKDAIAGGKEFFKNLIADIENNFPAYWGDKMNSTHPSLYDRLANLEAIEKKLDTVTSTT